MATGTIKLNNTLFYFFALLIIYLPFQRLLEQILLNRNISESLAFWSTRWYEPLITIALLINFYIALKNKSIKFNWIVLLSIVLIVLSLVSIFLLSPSISRGVEGFRFTAFFLLAFLAAYWSNFDQFRINKLTNIYLIMAGIFALWGIAERFLPLNYLVIWGLIAPGSNFGYGVHKVSDIYQSVTGIGGPNQLASYLLPAVFITIAKITNHKSQITNKSQISNSDNNETMKQSSNGNLALVLYYVIPIISITAIILTFSRSAWVGLYAGLLVATIILIKNLWLKAASIIILLVLAGGIGYYYLNKPNDILTHGASDQGHQTAYNLSMTEIENRTSQPVTLLLGSGLGTAGPAALKYGDGFVSESWYLQLVLELGVVGLVLWLIFIYYLLVLLYKKNKGLFLALIAVSATAIFLHTFADNPAMSMTLFALIGACVKRN